MEKDFLLFLLEFCIVALFWRLCMRLCTPGNLGKSCRVNAGKVVAMDKVLEWDKVVESSRMHSAPDMNSN